MKMLIEIFNVGHGHCSLVTCASGVRMMLDCGYRSCPPWFPYWQFFGKRIDGLVLTNLDEDHVADLPNLMKYTDVNAIFSNPSIDSYALTEMKREGGMGKGIKYVHSLIRRHGPGFLGPFPLVCYFDAWAYYNCYSRSFADTNNLSLAVFVRYGNFTILFPGDLETAGWKNLLMWPRFCKDLSTVNVFVASHHGRVNGQCDDVFRYCKPDVVIISDDARQYASQNTDAWYRARTNGIVDLRHVYHSNRRYKMRHVLSTRRDGTLKINIPYNGRFIVYPEKHHTIT